MRLRLLSFLVALCWPLAVWSAPSTTLTIDPSATSGTTITSSDENSRNSDVTTWANAHDHTDISQTANTLNLGDGAAGTKSLCANAADTTDLCIRWDDTADMWTIETDGSTADGMILRASGTAGLASRQVVLADGTGPLRATSGGSSGQVLTHQGDGSDPIWSGGTVADRSFRTAGNLTTTSTSLEDTGIGDITLTTGANPVLVGFAGTCRSADITEDIRLNVDVDGNLVMGTVGFLIPQHSTVNEEMQCSFTAMTTDLTAASHTFQLQFAVSGSTGTLGCTTSQACMFWVSEVID